MKILFLCHKTPFPANDGGAIATLNMITGFEQLHHEVSVLTMQTHKHNFSIDNFPHELTKNVKWQQQFVNTKINPFALLYNLFFSSRPYNAVRFDKKAFARKLQEILRTESFDIIQLEGAYLAPYVKTIRKFSKAKIALRAHNVEAEIWKRLAETEQNLLKGWYYRILYARVERLEKDLLAKVDYLVPITSKDARDLCFKDSAAVHVSPTGMTVDKFDLKEIKHRKTLFHIGALDWRPNQEGILWFLDHVWIVLKYKYTDWDFVIAGRNAPQEFVNKLKNYPIKYIGEVPDATEFIDDHNLMIVPLFAGSGLRIKIIEGMARGKCILTTPIGIEGIAAENQKEVYICNTKSEWVSNIEALITNDTKNEVCRKQAFEFAQKNYLNESIIKRLSDFYLQQLS